MLCDTRRRVAGDITYRNPCRLSCIQIHTVSSCGSNANKLQLRCLLKRCLVNDHLIGDGDVGVSKPLNKLIGRGDRISFELAKCCKVAEVNVPYCRGIQKANTVHAHRFTEESL